MKQWKRLGNFIKFFELQVAGRLAANGTVTGYLLAICEGPGSVNATIIEARTALARKSPAGRSGLSVFDRFQLKRQQEYPGIIRPLRHASMTLTRRWAGAAIVLRVGVPGGLAFQPCQAPLSLSASHTPASIMMATDPIGTKTRR